MDVNCVLSALDGLSKRGMNFGLERTRALLDGLGSPDEKLKIIHIAGTNGKGSTAEYITQILIAAGRRTGTFTSPEIYDYFAQFRIDGKSIEKELFSEGFSKTLAVAEEACSQFGGATRFEVETAAALYCFYLAGCEYAVLECGLGGAYDATNAVSKKEIALITSISLEHTAVLGSNILSICSHKAGIIKDCPAIVSGCVTGEARVYFEKLNVAFAEKYPHKNGVQAYNAGLAAACARTLGICENAIYDGVNFAKPAGRVEVIRRGTTYILDGAHNPEAFLPLCEFLRNIEKDNLTVIFGCLADKDIDGNLKALSAVADCVIAVECPSPRALPLEKTLEACKKYFRYAGKASSVAEAIIMTDTAFVAVCGSFTLLKEAVKWIGKR